MSLITNEYYQQLKGFHNVVGGVLSLVESQDIKITELERQIEDGLQASEEAVAAEIRAELQAQFDTAFTDALTLIGASTTQLSLIRDGVLGISPPPVIEPEPEPTVIPSL
jgi:hypothetical protein